MIYCIDENYRKLRALVAELKFNGFEVEVIRDADTAYQKLYKSDPNDIDLVLIDVMLAAKDQSEDSKYSRERTDDFHITGLVLLEDLILANPSVFPKYSALFSYASSAELVRKITSTADNHAIHYLKRNDFETAYEFGNTVQKIVEEINGDEP